MSVYSASALQPAVTLALVFATALLLSTATRLWLAMRQMRHVAAHRGRVPAAFAGRVSLDAHRRGADYTLAKARFGVVEAAFSAALLVGWTLLGGLDALNILVRDATLPRYGAMAYQLALLAAFGLVSGALELPFSCYGIFRLEQRFGFNRMTPRLYIADLARSTAVGAAVGLPVAASILWLMHAAGGLWWLWAWGAWMAFNLALLVLYPTLIAPLFNAFEPLADESLRTRVQSLMQRCGFAAKGLFVMDGSRRSAHANAYFTGFGAAKRVVFFDTLLAKLTPGEVEAVLAHELGHFKRRHVAKRIAAMFALSLVAFAALGWLSGRAWFYAGLGVQPGLAGPNDALALLLFLLVVPVFGYFVSPLLAHVSRCHEFEADAYASSQSNAADLAAALLKLHEDNAATLTPDPLYVRFYYSHPTASERLAALGSA
jgi:STE24 endopeptidase